MLRDTVSTTSGSTKGVYQNLVPAAGPVQASSSTAAPRNTMQIKNAMRRQRTAGCLTHGALFNLHEFAYDADFVKQITTFPDLEVLMYSPAIVQSSNCRNIHQVFDVNDKQWYVCVGLNLCVLPAKAANGFCLSLRNFVCPSVRHTGGSGTINH